MGIVDWFSKKKVDEKHINPTILMDEIQRAIANNNKNALIIAIKEFARLVSPPIQKDGKVPRMGQGIPWGRGTRYTKIENVELTPKMWEHDLFYNVGNECSRNDNYELAIEMYKEALERCKEPSTYNNMASSLKRLGKYQEALQNYLSALKIDPDYFVAYLRIAILIETYKLAHNRTSLDYIKEYFSRGGNMEQIQDISDGLPYDEHQTLRMFVSAMKHFSQE